MSHRIKDYRVEVAVVVCHVGYELRLSPIRKASRSLANGSLLWVDFEKSLMDRISETCDLITRQPSREVLSDEKNPLLKYQNIKILLEELLIFVRDKNSLRL